jgi:hypothetical protein
MDQYWQFVERNFYCIGLVALQPTNTLDLFKQTQSQWSLTRGKWVAEVLFRSIYSPENVLLLTGQEDKSWTAISLDMLSTNMESKILRPLT